MLNKEINNAFFEKEHSPLVLSVCWFILAWKLVKTISSLNENSTWCNYLTPVISHYLMLWIIYTVTGCFHEIKIIWQLLTLATSRQLELHKLYLFVQTLKYLSSSSLLFLQAISNYVIILYNFVRKRYIRWENEVTSDIFFYFVKVTLIFTIFLQVTSLAPHITKHIFLSIDIRILGCFMISKSILC